MRGRRIAALIVLAGVLAVSFAPAQARSPRDAIKRLPKFSHSSHFRIIQNDGPAGRTYNDNYNGNWTVDWNPPSVTLGPQAKLKYSVTYSTALSDLINRIDQQSNDLRRDYFEVNLNLKDASWIDAGYALRQTDEFKANGEWGSVHASSAFITWAPPDLPTLSYGYSSQSQTRRTRQGQSSASELEMGQYRVEYRSEGGAFGQRYFFIREDKRSRNYLPQGGTDEGTTRFEGDRQFPLGSVGNLNLAYSYAQYARSDFGTEEASTTTTNLYRLSLNNRLPHLPLSYNYTYSNLQQEFPADRGQTIATRTLDLVITPPTPQDKSSSIGYHDELRESDEPAKRIANTQQSLTWNVQTNKLTTGRFSYVLETDFDRLQHEVLRKREGYDSSLNYEIPGNRGNFSGNLAQWLESKPRGEARNSSSNLNLLTNVRLGPRANIIFNLAQQYSDSGSGLPGASFDTTRSRVQYRITWPNNLELDATYQQQLRVQTADNKTVTESFGVKFDYRNDANWAYTFSLNLGDTQDVTRIQPDSRQYETQNVIEARITYSF